MLGGMFIKLHRNIQRKTHVKGFNSLFVIILKDYFYILFSIFKENPAGCPAVSL